MAIKLSDERYEEIKRIVVRMFVEYGISCAPINGFEIAHKMGVKVIPYSAIAPGKRELLIKESEDGFSVQRTNGQWYISWIMNVRFFISLIRQVKEVVTPNVKE